MRFIAAPWTATDGAAFPDGKHIALTRWTADADKPNDQSKQRGNWQYCGAVSGSVVSDFFDKWTNAGVARARDHVSRSRSGLEPGRSVCSSAPRRPT